MAAPQPSRILPWPIAALAAGLVIAPFLARLPLLTVRGFNPDEFEHLHAAWCVAQGQLPYRDFFEHHTPGLYYLLAPLLALFDTATDVTDAWAAIFTARRVMWAFTAAVLVLTYQCGRLWRDRLTGAVAALLLGNAGIFLGKTLEIRPDVPALAFLMGSLLVLLIGLRAHTPRRWPLVAGGLLTGLALLMTQKALFVLPGLVLAAAIEPCAAPTGTPEVNSGVPPCARSLRDRGPDRGRESRGPSWWGWPRPRRCCSLWPASPWPAPAMRSSRATSSSTRAGNIASDPEGVFLELLRQDAALVVLGLAGIARAGWALRGSVTLGSWLVSLVVGAFVIPVVQRQYALLLLPLLALFAGSAVSDLWRWGGDRPRAGWLLGGLMLAGSVQPALRLRASFGRTNGGALENIRYVLRNTSPRETVWDGFSGEGVFRPHAYHYFFLHEEIRQMLPAREREALLGALTAGAVMPKIVLYDRHLRDLSPPLSAFVERHYAPVGRDPIRVRLFDNGAGWWDDQGWRPLAGPAGPPGTEPHVFIGEGWQRVESEDGRRFRGSRGRRSFLSVPVREGGSYRVWLRASGRTAAELCEVELVVNGQSLGVASVEGWREREFPSATPALRHGLNDFVLVPRRETGLRVESLRLVTSP